MNKFTEVRDTQKKGTRHRRKRITSTWHRYGKEELVFVYMKHRRIEEERKGIVKKCRACEEAEEQWMRVTEREGESEHHPKELRAKNMVGVWLCCSHISYSPIQYCLCSIKGLLLGRAHRVKQSQYLVPNRLMGFLILYVGAHVVLFTDSSFFVS